MKPVKSSNIEAIGHADGVLKVRFKNGTEYHFNDVPADVHAKLMAAESVGKHFNEHIKGKFGHKKQEPQK